MHSLGWPCTQLAIWPFPYVDLMVCCRWLGTPRCCFILSLSNGTLWFLLLTSSSCCKPPQNWGLDFLFDFLFLFLGMWRWNNTCCASHSVKKDKQKNSLTFVKFISAFYFLLFFFFIYVYGCMWGICTHSHMCMYFRIILMPGFACRLQFLFV